MRSPARAIAWEFRQQHRWGLVALASYFVIMATFKFLILGVGRPGNWDDLRFALVVVVPLATTFTYLLAVFTFRSATILLVILLRLFLLLLLRLLLRGRSFLFHFFQLAHNLFGHRCRQEPQRAC